MRAIQINGYGGPEVMHLNEAVVAPVAAAGEILVAIHAASVNPFDIKVREGLVREMAELQFPAILGADFAGVVAAIGDGVEEYQIGDEVYGMAGALSSHGSHAEFAAVKAAQLAAKPTSLNFNEAAALPLVAASAHEALVKNMQLASGQRILIHGGAGGIGSAAIQIAKSIGAYVATTASGDGIEFVKGLGADEVIDYTAQDFAAELSDFDAVFDVVGGETYAKSFAVLNKGGTIVSMVEAVNNALTEQYGARAVQQFTEGGTQRLDAIAKLVDAGTLKVVIDKTFPLADSANAFEHLKSGHPKGKVVIKIA